MADAAAAVRGPELGHTQLVRDCQVLGEPRRRLPTLHVARSAVSAPRSAIAVVARRLNFTSMPVFGSAMFSGDNLRKQLVRIAEPS